MVSVSADGVCVWGGVGMMLEGAWGLCLGEAVLLALAAPPCSIACLCP